MPQEKQIKIRWIILIGGTLLLGGGTMLGKGNPWGAIIAMIGWAVIYLLSGV